MPAKDFYHEQVKRALVKDGWTITHDPYTITYGKKDVFVDFGAERIIAAEKSSEKIVVEIKSFLSDSDLKDLKQAVGQFAFYRSLLFRVEPGRKLNLAVTAEVFAETFEEPIARPVLEDLKVPVITFDPEKEELVKWIN
jgi:hypothetical protein